MSSQQVLEFVNSFAQSLLIALIPVLVAVLMRWAKQEWKRVHLPEWLANYAIVAVKAAEQANIAGLIEDKKPYAIEALQSFLDAHGVKLDANALDAAIEEAVRNYKDEQELNG